MSKLSDRIMWEVRTESIFLQKKTKDVLKISQNVVSNFRN